MPNQSAPTSAEEKSAAATAKKAGKSPKPAGGTKALPDGANAEASNATETVAKSKRPAAAKKAGVSTASRVKTAVKKAEAAQADVVAAQNAKKAKSKQKLVRDSFTMPGNDYALIEELKKRATSFERPAKKSELLRAGLHVLAGLSDAKLKAALNALTPLKVGRPTKSRA